MRIDSHQHFWKLDHGDYHWMSPEFKPLYRDYLPSNMQSLAGKNRIDGTVVVQAVETEDETRFLLDLAKDTPSVLSIVGWVNMDAICLIQNSLSL